MRLELARLTRFVPTCKLYCSSAYHSFNFLSSILSLTRSYINASAPTIASITSTSTFQLQLRLHFTYLIAMTKRQSSSCPPLARKRQQRTVSPNLTREWQEVAHIHDGTKVSQLFFYNDSHLQQRNLQQRRLCQT